jgi:hypothetical protein
MSNNAPLPNNTASNISITWAGNDTIFINFDTIPTAQITYIVNPIGGGTITVDGTNVTVFPFTSNYQVGTTSNLTATANAGFFFFNWNFTTNIPLPNTTSGAISTAWNNDDTVYVNFSNIPNYSVTYLTNPLGAGTIDIDGVNQSTFPFTQIYQQGTNVILGASENINFSFLDWESINSALNPSTQAVFVDFDVIASDTIIANYNEVDTLWVITRPAGTAQLEVGGDVITSSPYMGLYRIGDILDINISPYSPSIFDQWDLAPVSLPDYSPSTSFIFIAKDTLFASLNNVLAIQDLGIDIGSVNLYPNLVQDHFTLEIEAEESLDLQLNLMDISGKIVHALYAGKLAKGQFFKEKFEVNQSTGVYFIQMITAKTSASFKIVKL